MTEPTDAGPATDPRLEAAGAWCLRLAKGALAPDDQARFQAWLEQDPENRHAFEDAVGVWGAVGEISLSPELLAMRRDALHGFEAANRVRWEKPRRELATIWRYAATAAAVLVLVGVAGTIGLSIRGEEYRTSLGERRVVVLSDGSKISLDAATAVKVRYSGDARRLWLEYGRAKFDVAKNARKPFTVAAADKVVRATGTQFSVELLRGAVEVVLYEGHVAVFSTPAGAAPRPIQVAVREKVNAGPSPVEADLLTPGHELVGPISASVAQVNRYSNQKLEIGDAKAGAVRIDGVFLAGDTDAFVEGVTGVFPVAVRDTADGKVLISRR
jgi:transmembrane sensor